MPTVFDISKQNRIHYIVTPPEQVVHLQAIVVQVGVNQLGAYFFNYLANPKLFHECAQATLRVTYLTAQQVIVLSSVSQTDGRTKFSRKHTPILVRSFLSFSLESHLNR